MKKIFLLFSASTIIFNTQAQTCDIYKTFDLKDETGLTDSDGNEVIMPMQSSVYYLPMINKIAFYQYDNSLLFDCARKKTDKYESISTDEISIQNTSYTLLTKQSKAYLLNQETGNILPLPEEIFSMQNQGRYIIAKYFKKYIPAPATKTTNSKIPPPPRPPSIESAYENDIIVYADNLEFKPLLKGTFTKITPLYKKMRSENDGLISVEVIDISTEKPFDAIVFSKADKHKLYDSKLHLIKEFTLEVPNNDYDDKIGAYCTKLLFKENSNEIVTNNQNEYSSVAVIPPAYNAGRPVADTVPERVFPDWSIESSLNDGNQFVIHKSVTESKTLFTTTNNIRYNKDGYVTISDKDGNTLAHFYTDLKTGKIYFPKKYWKNAGMN